ncbi:MAG: pyrroloquinoline quinone biosynthesis protein PqqB, partial [Fulvivirga sp.]|nr:pyrroloquinoline quinone biosynthesis protein PqqB [Fulvivirga sp.]
MGNVQDAGSPHIGCEKSCCKILYDNPQTDRMVVSLGIVDPETKRYWLVEATPDMPKQLKALQDHVPFNHAITPDGIFLT